MLITMNVTPEQFAALVTEALQDPERMGSDPAYGVQLLRVGSGYHLRPVGYAPAVFVLECYRTIYSIYQPTVSVVPPPV
ncbi:hypothetical protein [Oxalicibacterium faecigallinarum]|uniref:Uncharacterized protein n=1 Tax=Oxalicibacterium faecigallinarum TaxID=573741 RepID=A0A8J3APP3_9BURK|nr:hypothetical protein [Oxalicibacterium faecigallinarum]GGI17798.1 hypothetical protein GCM10008066_10790 [Oxalicibacterium faecigallinarum]